MKTRRRLPKLTLEQLETWFEKARPAPPCEGVSMLNGFLTGLVAGPVFITPNDWMGEVIGAHEARAVMGTKAQAVIDTIVDQRWPAKFGQADKWKICLKAAKLPRIRSMHDQANTPDPRRGL